MPRIRLRLTFPTELIQEPIVYRLVKDFDLVINIRRADVKADHGWIALELEGDEGALERGVRDRKSTRLNSSHTVISYAVFCLKKKKKKKTTQRALHKQAPRDTQDKSSVA